jgi:hypothetical protein
MKAFKRKIEKEKRKEKDKERSAIFFSTEQDEPQRTRNISGKKDQGYEEWQLHFHSGGMICSDHNYVFFALFHLLLGFAIRSGKVFAKTILVITTTPSHHFNHRHHQAASLFSFWALVFLPPT